MTKKSTFKKTYYTQEEMGKILKMPDILIRRLVATNKLLFVYVDNFKMNKYGKILKYEKAIVYPKSWNQSRIEFLKNYYGKKLKRKPR